jgi:predicted transcriptional regulator of viral defense system
MTNGWIKTIALINKCNKIYPMNTKTKNIVLALFREHGPILRTREILELGVHPRTLYELRDSGDLVRMSRGIYCLPESAEMGLQEIAATALRAPQGVVCLVSALSFHNITTEIPRAVYLALPRPKTAPRIDYPPVRIFTFARDAYDAGIEEHDVEGVKVKIYDPAKTVVDCFKFRNRIGLDVAIEALRFCTERRSIPPRVFLDYARTCRVERVMMPYLEALA